MGQVLLVEQFGVARRVCGRTERARDQRREWTAGSMGGPAWATQTVVTSGCSRIHAGLRSAAAGDQQDKAQPTGVPSASGTAAAQRRSVRSFRLCHECSESRTPSFVRPQS